jgi:hypothetical protein
VNVKYSYDEKCLDLARHFYPMQSIAFLEALAQTIQDCVEGREEIPSEPTPRYQCMVEGCPINHVSKRDVCSTVETKTEHCGKSEEGHVWVTSNFEAPRCLWCLVEKSAVNTKTARDPNRCIFCGALKEKCEC